MSAVTESLSSTINQALSEGTIILTSPIREVKDYFTHWEIPSIYFLIRLVKTCAMSIFRRHFYDVDHVIVVTQAGQCMHTFDGCLKSETPAHFTTNHHFLLEHAVLLKPGQIEIDEGEGERKVKKSIIEGQIDFRTFQSNFKQSLSLAYVVTYYKEVLGIKGFPEKLKGSLEDIWNNENFHVIDS